MTREKGERWISPATPSVDLTLAIHRPTGQDETHTVSFGRKIKGSEKPWQSMGCLPAWQLAGLFPAVRDLFEQDAYFSLNGFVVPEKARGTLNPITGLNLSIRRAKLVSFLTSAFVDLDLYNPRVSSYRAEMEILRMVHAGEIPHWSIKVDSGRGIWLFWLLSDDPTGTRAPIRCWPEKLLRWGEIQRAIGARFKHLGWDTGACDASRVARLSGSLNSKSGRRVRYLVSYDEAGKPFCYSLPELEGALGIVAKERTAKQIRNLSERNPAKVRAGQQGSLGRWSKDLQRLISLYDLRGGWQQGTRSNGIWLLGGALRYVRDCALRSIREGGAVDANQVEIASMSNQDLKNQIREWCKGCNPELTKEETAERLAEAFPNRIGNPRQKVMSRMLKVTEEELEALEAAGLDRGKWEAHEPSSARRLDPAAPPTSPQPQEVTPTRREDLAEVRRAMIRALLADLGGKVPPISAIIRHLERFGAEAARRTIAKDLALLGVQNPRSRAARDARLESERLPF